MQSNGKLGDETARATEVNPDLTEMNGTVTPPISEQMNNVPAW